MTKDGKFTFTEEEFKDTYEEVNDVIMPENISVGELMINLDFSDKKESIRLLKAVAEQFDSDDVDKLINSVEEDVQDYYVVELDGVDIIYDAKFEDSVSTTIKAKGE